ncbi:MAG: hypothetical protein AAGA10_10490 [Bacteroidota bacterium]
MLHRLSALSLFAFVLCISLSSCTLIQGLFTQSIDNFGGQLSSVDTSVYDTLNYYKGLTEDIGRKSQPLLASNSEEVFRQGIQRNYEAVQTLHNDLVSKMARRIRLNQSVSLADFSAELSQLRIQQEALISQFSEVTPTSDPRQIPEELKKLGLEILEELGKFLVRKEYAKAFERKYRIVGWGELG